VKTRTRLRNLGIFLSAFAMLALSSRLAIANGAPQEAAKPAYTIPEYNAFQAANSEKDPTTKLKDLDDFVAKFPNSTLLQYVYQLYYQTYLQQKNYAKEIEYADKLIAVESADLGSRLQASLARVQAFPAVFDSKAPNASDQLTKQRDAALMGAKLLQQLPKPAAPPMTDDQFNDGKKPALALFNSAAGQADLQMKDYPSAITAFKAALSFNPTDAGTEYQLGLAYLAMTPPQSMDGFWALARAIQMKVPQSDKVKDYLRAKMLAYEQPTCENLLDAQVSELMQLSASSTDLPASYSIPSSADLQKIAQGSTIVTVLADLSGGGDKAKNTWLAICGAEFPEVVGKIIDEQKTDTAIDFMVFFGATEDEVKAATTANMDVKVYLAAPPAPPAGQTAPTPQPDVVRLQKDDGIRFAGTVTKYDPSPFMLYWDGVKVDPTIIPEAETTGKKAPAKRAAPKP